MKIIVFFFDDSYKVGAYKSIPLESYFVQFLLKTSGYVLSHQSFNFLLLAPALASSHLLQPCAWSMLTILPRVKFQSFYFQQIFTLQHMDLSKHQK